MTTLHLLSATLALDHSGALWWPQERTLVVADMHLEKGSAYARRGQMLPPYDSARTLAQLTRLVARLRPRRLIALGDSFHDVQAGERMAPAVADALQALAAGLDMVWIAGNHDPEIPDFLPGTRAGELTLGPLTFRHEPQAGEASGEVAGHLHPAARVISDKGSLRRKAFVTDGTRLLLPAFGAYAGGLSLRDPAIARLFDQDQLIAHVCGTTRVYAVGPRRLAL
jgi:uncharacterized protein